MTIPKTRKLYYDDVRKSCEYYNAIVEEFRRIERKLGKLVEQIQSLLNNNNTCITSNICINSNRICSKISFSHFYSAEAAEYFFRRRRVSQNKIMMKAAAATAEKRTMTVMNFANGYQAVENDMCRQFSLYYPSIFKEQHTFYPFGATITSCDECCDRNLEKNIGGQGQ